MGTKGSMLIAWTLYGLAIFLEDGIEPKLPERPKNFGVWPVVGFAAIGLLVFAAGYLKFVSDEIYEVIIFPLAVVLMYALILTVEYWRYHEYRKTLPSYPDATSVDA